MENQEEKGMQFGAGRPSKRHQRRLAMMWRLFDTRLATRKHLGALAAARKTKHLNLNNKPLGDKE